MMIASDADLAERLKPLGRHLRPVPWPPARETSPLTVSCLGPFQLGVQGRLVECWRSSKARALFQFLISQRGRPISRDVLIQAIWPDPGASAPGTSLKVAVHALRATLTEAGGAETLVISSHGCGYQLNASDAWVDVEEFEQCYTLGRLLESQGRIESARPLYARAAELYRGDYLEEIPDEWPIFRREALKDQYLFMVSHLAKNAVEECDYAGGIHWCQQILAKDCCREDAYRLLMTSHSRLGQRGRVRRWYDVCVRTLRSELDCPPEAETQRIFRLAHDGKA